MPKPTLGRKADNLNLRLKLFPPPRVVRCVDGGRSKATMHCPFPNLQN